LLDQRIWGGRARKMRVLFLTRYGRRGASSRLRTVQFLRHFEEAGFEFSVRPLIGDELLSRKYSSGKYGFTSLAGSYFARIIALLKRKYFDLVWIEKEALPWMPSVLESFLLSGVPYVLDFDDAIFHQYDEHPNVVVRRLFKARIDRLMSGARMVIVGNSYLGQRAHNAGCARVEVIPTVVDLGRYNVERPGKERPSASCRIVWIGSPATAGYLDAIQEPLVALSRIYPYTLRVIGAPAFALPNVDLEAVEWSEATEVDAIGECDIGIMPLRDGKWERGKCGYKLIQYMACGLPVVGSDVGVNSEIICHGANGYLANTNEDWVRFLSMLIDDAELRLRLGTVGRARVARSYSVQQVAPKLIKLLREASVGR